jgi:hypothetical protein
VPLDGRRSALAHDAVGAGKLDAALGTLAARAPSHALKQRVDGILRERAANGRYAWTLGRAGSSPPASGSSTRCSCSTPAAQLADAGTKPVREERYITDARLDDDELRDASRTTTSAAPQLYGTEPQALTERQAGGLGH